MGRVGPKEKKPGAMDTFKSILDVANKINNLSTPATDEPSKPKPLVGDFTMNDDDDKNPFRIG
jgi:hypothetical protein